MYRFVSEQRRNEAPAQVQSLAQILSNRVQEGIGGELAKYQGAQPAQGGFRI